MLSDPILMLLIGSVSGFLLVSCKFLYASKCNKIKCCCIEVTRDTDHEQQLLMPPSPITKPS